MITIKSLRPFPSFTLIAALSTAALLPHLGLVQPALAQPVSGAVETPQIVRIKAMLKQTIEEFRADGEEVRIVVEGMARSYGLPILIEPEITGKLTFTLYQSPLASVLDAICAPNGWSWSIEPAGYVMVKRFETRIYRIDYLPVTQTGTSSASVTLTGSNSSSGNGQNGSSGSGSSGSTGGSGQNGSSGGGSSGGSTLSLSQNTEADFWGRYEKDIAAMLHKDEAAIINKFGGMMQVTASGNTHARIEAYSRTLMERVRRQVFISVQIMRVDLNNSSQLGVDWNAAAFQIGSGRNAPLVGGNFSLPGAAVSGQGLAASTNVTSAGALSLPNPTFSGVVQAGKVSALVRALQQQGKVKMETKPEIATLNNVPAFVQISEDRSFFKRDSQTTFNQGTTTGSGSTPPVTDTTYTERIVSFGNVLEVVPQISDANEVQLALQPAITDLRGVDLSPDGQSNAPRQGVSRLRSVVTLRDGETYVMGGFISDTNGETSRRIPVLGSIPYVGALFRTDGKIVERSEIAVLVSVRVRQPEATAPTLVPVAAPGPIDMTQRASVPLPAVSPAPVVAASTTVEPSLSAPTLSVLSKVDPTPPPVVGISPLAD